PAVMHEHGSVRGLPGPEIARAMGWDGNDLVFRLSAEHESQLSPSERSSILVFAKDGAHWISARSAGLQPEPQGDERAAAPNDTGRRPSLDRTLDLGVKPPPTALTAMTSTGAVAVVLFEPSADASAAAQELGWSGEGAPVFRLSEAARKR